MTASELLDRVLSYCPHKPTDPNYITWIKDEIKHVENLDNILSELKKRRDKEHVRHQEELRKLDELLKQAQLKCRHNMIRGDSYCDPTCSYCGWINEDKGCGYDG
jgi:hypothetical protein